MVHLLIWIPFLIMLTFSPENLSQKSMAVDDEICDNAIDDDNDGLIDINDPDCICETVNLESYIPNPSFEEYDCCPQTDSQLNCAEGWNQASGGTTDYLNSCDYIAPGGENLLPFPDGEGAVLFLTGTVNNGNGPELYNEYAGACLNRTMEKDSVYKFKFHVGFLDEESSPPIVFSFFGSPSCTNLPFSQLADCPTNYPDWHFLKSEVITGGTQFPDWVEVTTIIQPGTDIDALVIGGSCNGDNEGKLRIYFIDNLRLNDESNFDFDLVDQVSPCDPNFSFSVAENADFSYQWYKEGIALIGETNAELVQMYGEGTYQLRLINEINQQCRIADDFEFTIPVFTNEVFETICEGEELLFEGDIIENAGIYEYTLSSVDGCDSIVTLNVEKHPQKTEVIYAKVLAGSTYSIGDAQFTNEGEHHIKLVTSYDCDSTIVLHLENISVFIPNSFSPNGDNRNDYFEVFTSEDDLISIELSVFDRWGNLLYLGSKWNGIFENRFVNPGVYVYLVKIIDTTGQELILRNSFTLIK